MARGCYPFWHVSFFQRGPKRSLAWDHFAEVQLNGRTVKVQCKHCERYLSFNRNTSGMVRHLDTVHNITINVKWKMERLRQAKFNEIKERLTRMMLCGWSFWWPPFSFEYLHMMEKMNVDEIGRKYRSKGGMISVTTAGNVGRKRREKNTQNEKREEQWD